MPLQTLFPFTSQSHNYQNLAKNLLNQEPTLIEGFETFSDWTFTLATGSDNTTEFTQGSHGLKLTSNGSSNTPTALKTVSLNLSAGDFISADIYCHDAAAAGRTVNITFGTNSTATAGMQASFTMSRTGWNRVLVPKSSFTAGGGATWNSTFIRIRVAYGGSASGQNVTVDNLCSRVLNQPAVVMTWDDNNPSQYTTVLPALRSRGLRSTLFINSANVGVGGRLTWAQLREFRDAGWTVGNHTTDHTDLTTLGTQAEMEAKIADCRTAMLAEGIPDLDTRLFAYPFAGGYNATVEAAAAAAGMVMSRTGYPADVVMPPIHMHRLECRLVFGQTLSSMQGWVDTIKARGLVLIIISHGAATTPSGSDDMATASLTGLADYCIAQNVPWITYKDLYTLLSTPITVQLP